MRQLVAIQPQRSANVWEWRSDPATLGREMPHP